MAKRGVNREPTIRIGAVQDDHVTIWMDKLRQADDSAAEKLWSHFVGSLYRAARGRLKPNTRRVYDEEDAAQSAFHSVCAGIQAGRFPKLRDRDCLWRLLLRVTALKVAQRHRFDTQQRRDVRRNVSDSIFVVDENSPVAVGQLAAREPTPEFTAQFVELCGQLFKRLDDPILQSVAELRMEGYSDPEIAKRLNCSRRSVQRRVEAIRRHWESLVQVHE